MGLARENGPDSKVLSFEAVMMSFEFFAEKMNSATET